MQKRKKKSYNFKEHTCIKIEDNAKIITYVL